MSEQQTSTIEIAVPAPLLAAIEQLAATKVAYYQQTATHDELRAAAVAVLEQRRAAEIAKYGKARSKIDNLSIAKLLR